MWKSLAQEHRRPEGLVGFLVVFTDVAERVCPNKLYRHDVSFPSAPEAMRDARFRPAAPGSVASTYEVAEWRRRAEAFLDGELKDEAAEDAKPSRADPRWHRLATHDLICGMDWQMAARRLTAQNSVAAYGGTTCRATVSS